MARVLIIGCGYLGERVAERALSRGDTVLATTRKAERVAEWTARGLHPVIWDVTAPGRCDELPATDVVIWSVGFDRTAGHSQRAVYVDGLAATLAALPTPAKFVYVGSTGVYGQDDGEWVTEDSPIEPSDEAGRVNRDAEAVVLRAAGERNLPAIIVRSAGLYGPGRWPGLATVKAGGVLPGEPNRWLNLIHVDDAATAVLAAADRGVPGRAYLLADGSPIPRIEYYRLLAATVGAPEPRFAGGVQTGTGTVGKRIDSRRMRQELGVALRWPDLAAALAESELQP